MTPRARDAEQDPDPRRSSGWAAWVGIAAALAVAIGLVIAVVAGN